MTDNTSKDFPYWTCEQCMYWDTFGLCGNTESMRFNQDVRANAIACDSFVEFKIDDECEGCKLS